MDRSDDWEQYGTWLGMSITTWAFALIFVLGAADLMAYASPWFLHKETQTTRQSLSYVTTHHCHQPPAPPLLKTPPRAPW